MVVYTVIWDTEGCGFERKGIFNVFNSIPLSPFLRKKIIEEINLHGSIHCVCLYNQMLTTSNKEQGTHWDLNQELSIYRLSMLCTDLKEEFTFWSITQTHLYLCDINPYLTQDTFLRLNMALNELGPA